jgi:hypothetical protein
VLISFFSISWDLHVSLFSFFFLDLGFKCIFGVDDLEIISLDGSNFIYKGFRYENL